MSSARSSSEVEAYVSTDVRPSGASSRAKKSRGCPSTRPRQVPVRGTWGRVLYSVGAVSVERWVEAVDPDCQVE